MSQPFAETLDLVGWDGRDRPVIKSITIIIPTLGRQLLTKCLQAILSGSHWPAQILIINQGDEAEVNQWISDAHTHQLRLHHEKVVSTGKATNLNHAFKLIESSFMAIIDDDCLVEPSWLFLMHANLQRHEDAIITGRVDASDSGPSVSIISEQEAKIYKRPLLKYDPLYGGNMGLSVQTQRKIGMFDESSALRFAEDNDFGYRALRLNVPIIYSPEIAVLHVNWRDEQQVAARYLAYARSQGGFYGKHIKAGDMFMLYRFGRDQIRGPIRWLKGLLTGNRDDTASGRALTMELLPGLIAGVRHD